MPGAVQMEEDSARLTGQTEESAKSVMTFQQFGWWLDENGYLDRVGKWELNEIRVIGNKARYMKTMFPKEDAWNQYNYMEDLLRIVADRHANRHKKQGPEIKKSQTGHYGTNVRKNIRSADEHAVRISHRDADSQKDIARIRLDEAQDSGREGRTPEIRRRKT